jgi:hypothetical protein
MITNDDPPGPAAAADLESTTATTTTRPRVPRSEPHRLVRFKWWVILILSSLILAGSLIELYSKLYDGVTDWELTAGQRRTFYLSTTTTIFAMIGLAASTMPQHRWCTIIESILIVGIVTTYAVGSVFSLLRPEPPAVSERFVIGSRK